MLRTREQVRVLGPGDRDAFIALAEQDPVVNVFADYRARLTNLDERWLGGQVWGRFDDGELVAGCHLGANLVPVQCTPEDVGAFADVALRRRSTVGTIVGPADVVAALWEIVEPRWARPREIRSDQPHLEADRVPAVAADPGVRVTTPRDLELLYPACVAMYTEEVGVSPESDTGGGELYRARIQQLIGRGWSMASFDADGVVFKAEVACLTPYAAQVQGVWVRPDRRGQGLATSGMAAVVAHVLGSGMAPVVSLYVNEWNAPARAAYARVGFRQTATFATLMF
ncbi:GNAT family N-acetyltransferase [Nocardioides sp. zg-1228]|uniref:GNAT family N-acetyltransferase n=1 Tax=Nocardioides sp. zg-1228 TaxID=2763008 RepID=UPI00164358FE|nr:GNAT family N-acetyltransferase [Nocardioides sp. zg-1228]MBC2933401.1 GNAT family N-acetyltransferase [Nocardioides sp. zg-1228]QSF56448.1 GNAT family N-acetyltransferase [Nocardioides sp. zg-1228]